MYVVDLFCGCGGFSIPEELGKGDGFKLVGNAVAPPIAYLIMKSM
jgi:site-specific DNA-cytosine methylase